MKFSEGFEVQLLKPNSCATYPDLSHGDQRYVVGVPEQAFEVRVTAPSWQFISGHIRAVLRVDNRDIGVCHILTRSKPFAHFAGFVSNVSGQNLTRQFLFGTAKKDSEGSAHSLPQASKTGGIEVKFTAVQEVPGYTTPVPLQTLESLAAYKAVEGKKWFMQPSLSAQQGPITGPAITYSTKKYVDVRHLATCTMRMETASILILRKVLKPVLPAHQAIIDQSEAATPQQEATSPAVATPAVANVASNRATGIQRERTKNHGIGIKRDRTADAASSTKAVKREPEGSGGVAQQTPECIDLSGIMIPAGNRARRQQKTECIDLS